MTAVDQTGYASIALTFSGDKTVSVRLSNIKPTALDADVYEVALALSALLAYPLASINRVEKTLLNA